MEPNDENPLVSIIILNYNAGKLIEECVESIYQSNYKNYEIIIVDNNSKDNSHVECKEKFPLINLIENKKNLGYCEGNNVGIRKSKGEINGIFYRDRHATEWKAYRRKLESLPVY